jgi:predicted alpha/beta-fold hydrolase
MTSSTTPMDVRRHVSSNVEVEAPPSATAAAACAITRSFEARPFTPVWWGGNPHIMTIGGAGSLEKQLGAALSPLEYRREFWDTPDGDRIAVDFSDASPAAAPTGKPIVVMTHGLESRSNAPLTERMARAFNRCGYDVCVVSFRSCAHDDDVPRRPGGYHLGFTDDVNFVTKKIFSETKRSIYLSGFSLGGNVVLKLLGELGADAPRTHGICGAAVTCVPFKPADCAPLLSEGFNRMVYSGNFLKSLKPKAKAQFDALGAEAFGTRFDLDTVLAADSIGAFDDAFIAPIYGFKDKWHYYETQGCASGGYLQKIAVPTLALNAIDDPFIESSTLPTIEEVGADVPLRLVYHRYGGHCGFVSDTPPPRDDVSGDTAPLQTRDWLPVELARFVDHCEARPQNP